MSIIVGSRGGPGIISVVALPAALPPTPLGPPRRRLVHLPRGTFAEPGEPAAAVAFLAGADSSFLTGSTFLVDGGISAAYVTPV